MYYMMLYTNSVTDDRHMYANFKKHFKGSKLHTLFWNAARAYKAKHFQVWFFINLCVDYSCSLEYLNLL